LLVLPRGRRFRLLGWMFLTVFGILAFSGTSRASYLAPAFTWLFAAGGVAWEPLLARGRGQWPAWATVILLLGGGAAVAPLALPILPVESYLSYARELGVAPSTEEKKEIGALPQFFADMHGWEAIAGGIIDAAQSLPEEERRRVRVSAPDYGVAGAVDYFGGPMGLAPALSGHNGYWFWGPGDLAETIIIDFGGRREDLEQIFDQVELYTTVDCGYCMPYENHRPVWICRQPKVSLEEMWPRMKHFD